jgi:hypothetical protein
MLLVAAHRQNWMIMNGGYLQFFNEKCRVHINALYVSHQPDYVPEEYCAGQNSIIMTFVISTLQQM